MTTESKRLRTLIDRHGIPIYRLAGALGVTKQTIHNQLSGKAPVSQMMLLTLRYVPTEDLEILAERAAPRGIVLIP